MLDVQLALNKCESNLVKNYKHFSSEKPTTESSYKQTTNNGQSYCLEIKMSKGWRECIRPMNNRRVLRRLKKYPETSQLQV